MNAKGVFAAAAAIRESRAKRLEDIARESRIALLYLLAMEELDFKRLPGGLYNVSYIRQYARAVGVDEGELVTAYFELNPEVRTSVGAQGDRGAAERVAALLRNVRAALARLLPY